MNRKKPLRPGAKSCDRGSTFAAPRKQLERKSQLERVSSLKSTTDGKGKGRAWSPPTVEQRVEWAMVCSTPCVMCAAFPPSPADRSTYAPEMRKLDPHHLIPKGTLIREGHAAHIHDPRNGICLCRFHHSRHHAHTERIPRSLLPVAVFEFAAELGLEAFLDREYPVVEQHPLNNAIGQEAA